MPGFGALPDRSALPRASGVLLHPTALPARFGIGDLGPEACRFVDFLSRSGQTFWQILPLGPVDPAFDNSPYMSYSALAGLPLLISPEGLMSDGLLDRGEVEAHARNESKRISYMRVKEAKERLLRQAFSRLGAGFRHEFEEFCDRERAWLDDFALFMALKDRFGGRPWFEWPVPLVTREHSALEEFRRETSAEARYYRFVQFVFRRQWTELKNYALNRHVRFIGDLPIYVAHDSVDAWCYPGYFDLDPETRALKHVAGVPPDYFSLTGQRWGNPLYRWQLAGGEPNIPLFEWWAGRLSHLLSRVDLIRIDHFRGFEAYWEVPAAHETAEFGRWVKGPGRDLFSYMKERIPALPIIAEDLGLITPAVEMLREDLGFPGMKVLQFAFDSGTDNKYLPFNYEDSNFIVYTGTHDNDTATGWFQHSLNAEQRERVLRYLGSDGREIHWDLIRYAMASTARVSIFPLQDILGLGTESRVNVPGTSHGNWTWRLPGMLLDETVEERLAELTRMYRRWPEAG